MPAPNFKEEASATQEGAEYSQSQQTVRNKSGLIVKILANDTLVKEQVVGFIIDVVVVD